MLGSKVQLASQEVTVEKCVECSHLMVNIDADQLRLGDLSTLKRAGIRISNPNTEKAYCVNCEVDTYGGRVARWFDTDDDDDSSFFGGSGSSGGFGGFGGGGFGGGGASRGF